MVKAALIAAILFLSSCQTGGGSFCSIESPDRPRPEEIAVMSDAVVSKMLAHNLKGQKLCGWKP
jgi:hypothetical protein